MGEKDSAKSARVTEMANQIPLGKTRLVTTDNMNALSQVAEELKQGKLVAFPTDTVYGVGVADFNREAVARLYEVKRRARYKPIPILVTGLEQLHLVARVVNPLARKLIERFWP